MSALLQFAPVALAGVVWAIEWYGHKHHKPWSFELGIPLGARDELLDAEIPVPIPEHWVANFNVESVVGQRLTFTPDVNDETATCFGVLTLSSEGKRTNVHFARRASFGPLAFAAALFAWMRLSGSDLEASLFVGAIFGAAWLFQVWRHRSRLDQEYELLSAALLRQAVER